MWTCSFWPAYQLLSVYPCLEWQKMFKWTLCAKFSARFFQTCYPYRHHLTQATFHKISTKQNRLASFSCILVNGTWWNLVCLGCWRCGGEAIQAEHLRLLLSEIMKSRENWFYWVHLRVLMLAYIRTFMNWFGSNLVWWQMKLLYSLLLVCDLDLDLWSQGCKKAKTSALVNLWMGLDGMWNVLETFVSYESHTDSI